MSNPASARFVNYLRTKISFSSGSVYKYNDSGTIQNKYGTKTSGSEKTGPATYTFYRVKASSGDNNSYSGSGLAGDVPKGINATSSNIGTRAYTVSVDKYNNTSVSTSYSTYDYSIVVEGSGFANYYMNPTTTGNNNRLKFSVTNPHNGVVRELLINEHLSGNSYRTQYYCYYFDTYNDENAGWTQYWKQSVVHYYYYDVTLNDYNLVSSSTLNNGVEETHRNKVGNPDKNRLSYTIDSIRNTEPSTWSDSP